MRHDPQTGFQLTRRHYDIILKQGLDLLPIEAGGFLGGDGGMVKAIFPIYNNYVGNQTGTFGILMEDIGRSISFFKKHGLHYFGPYHTHPKGISYPSKADIKTGQRYHFILSLRDKNNPVFNAFFIDKNVPHQVPFTIVEKGYAEKDLSQPDQKKDGKDHPSALPVTNEQSELINKVQDIQSQKAKYKREDQDGFDSSSSFSTFA